MRPHGSPLGSEFGTLIDSLSGGSGDEAPNKFQIHSRYPFCFGATSRTFRVCSFEARVSNPRVTPKEDGRVGGVKEDHTGVSEKNTPFRRVLALQSLSRSSYPAPDLVLRKPIFLIVLFSGGVFFHRHRYV